MIRVLFETKNAIDRVSAADVCLPASDAGGQFTIIFQERTEK